MVRAHNLPAAIRISTFFDQNRRSFLLFQIFGIPKGGFFRRLFPRLCFRKERRSTFLIYNMVANFRFFCFLTRIFPQNRQLRTPLRHRFQMSFRSLFRQRFNPLFAFCFFSFSSFEKPLSKNFRNACCITSVTPPFRDVFRPLFSLRNIAPKRCINMVLTVV